MQSLAPQTIRSVSRHGVLLALVALIVFGWLRYDNFLGSFNILTVLRYNAMFALVALGMAYVIMTGGIDLSVGSTAALGSVVAALLSPTACCRGSSAASRRDSRWAP
jgi:ribose transport system permease protein